MRDLTDVFTQALRRRQDWGRGQCGQTLKLLVRQVPNGSFDWDEDENWGMLLKNGTVAAYVCRVCPLVLLRKDMAANLAFPAGVEVVLVASFDEQAYMIEEEVVRELAGREVSDGVDYGACSIGELWWATVI